jgi:hypothetical protein
MYYKKNVVGGSSMIGFPLVIAVPEQNLPGFEPGPLGLHTSVLTNELGEGRQSKILNTFLGSCNSIIPLNSKQTNEFNKHL